MGKAKFHRYTLTEEVIAKRLKAGRGVGNGPRYRPWIYVSDLSSKGLSVKVSGAKTGRIHHLLSDLEVNAFQVFQHDDRVIDIREQFPLDRAVTRAIAENLGVMHPYDPKSGVDIVMTTDFLLDMQQDDGAVTSMAVSCKYQSDAETIRFQEKFEIERIYWSAKSTKLQLFDQWNTTRARRNNLQTAYAHGNVDQLAQPAPDYFHVGAQAMLRALKNAPPWAEINKVWDCVSASGALDRRHCSNVFWYLVELKAVQFDMDRAFSARMPISQLRLSGGELDDLRG